jgi:GNAT superfamily N-acetyltransferase
MALNYRTANFDDAELAADIMTAAYPAIAQDPVMTRYHWERPRTGWAYGRFLADANGVPIAHVEWRHGPWEKIPDRHCEVEVWLDRSALDDDLSKSLWLWISEQAEAEGSKLLVAYAAEDELEMLNALAATGYTRARAAKVWELDLEAHGPRIVTEAKDARDKMTPAGISFATLAEWRDPDALRKVFTLVEQTVQDVPHTVTIPAESYDDFVERMGSPDRPLDRVWIACDADLPIALSFLRFPPVRGPVWTGYTCTDRNYRGRGIARAVKLQGLAQAVELGVPFVCTDNDSENAPMLHINETLGYLLRPGFVEHHKRVIGT